MRAVGYSFEAALADLIDNSIAAGAHTINVRFSVAGDPYVAIVDDGHGMWPDELTAAMRHGSRNPVLQRDSMDLGRFGLGLKTASLSQCRTLTVVAWRDRTLSARRWDLDYVAHRSDWMLLDVPNAATLPHVNELVQQPHGTMVLWQHFDKLSAGESSTQDALGERMDLARDHLSLVFHRFLGSRQHPLSIALNMNPLRALDPFLTAHKATQPLPEEEFTVEGERVRVAPYILPHLSKLSASDLQVAGGEEGLRRNQGFYVYRNQRLITWGSWFRLIRQEELTKLARVQVDTTNRLDHVWRLDIKKSTAHPPEALRNGFRQIICRITEGSRRVYTFRGRRTGSDKIIHAWDRNVVRGGVTYRINREHLLVDAVERFIPEHDLPLFQQLLHLLENSFPFDAVYADKASERRPETDANQEDEQHLLDVAQRIIEAIGDDKGAVSRFLAALPSMEPYSKFPNLSARILRQLTS
jgi:histidine kinase/DNA gyrase B/HSP90-like ATPase